MTNTKLLQNWAGLLYCSHTGVPGREGSVTAKKISALHLRTSRDGAGVMLLVITWWRCQGEDDTECPLVGPDRHPIRHQDTHTAPPPPAAWRRKSGHRGHEMCPGQHTQSTGWDLSPGGPGCRTWGPHHWRATCPSAPGLGPPLHARAHWSQSRALGWLWYQEAFRSWLCPLAHPGLPSYTITCTGPRSQGQLQDLSQPKTLLMEKQALRPFVIKWGGGGSFNYTPFSKTRNKCLQFWDLDINGSCQLSSL